MSLTVFLAFCIPSCDFLRYALFQRTYGEKHTIAVARRHAATDSEPSLANNSKTLACPLSPLHASSNQLLLIAALPENCRDICQQLPFRAHSGSHPMLFPRKTTILFSSTYMQPILQPFSFHIHAWNGRSVPPPLFYWPELADRPGRLLNVFLSDLQSKIPTLSRRSTVNPLCSAPPRATDHESRPCSFLPSIITSLLGCLSRRFVRRLLHCSTYGTPTSRPTFPRRSSLARRNRARHSRFAAFPGAARWRRSKSSPASPGRSALLDRNRFRAR